MLAKIKQQLANMGGKKEINGEVEKLMSEFKRLKSLSTEDRSREEEAAGLQSKPQETVNEESDEVKSAESPQMDLQSGGKDAHDINELPSKEDSKPNRPPQSKSDAEQTSLANAEESKDATATGTEMANNENSTQSSVALSNKEKMFEERKKKHVDRLRQKIAEIEAEMQKNTNLDEVGKKLQDIRKAKLLEKIAFIEGEKFQI